MAVLSSAQLGLCLGLGPDSDSVVRLSSAVSGSCWKRKIE